MEINKTELAARLYKHHKAETKQPLNASADEIAERLWSRMMALYGRQWEASYGLVDGDAFPEWSKALSTMTPAQIKTGLDAVVAEGNEFPPNLIKFLRLCRITTPAYFNPATLLPAPKNRDTKAQQKWRDEARKLGCLGVQR